MNAVATEEEIVAQAREIVEQYEEPGIEARETEAVTAVRDILNEARVDSSPHYLEGLREKIASTNTMLEELNAVDLFQRQDESREITRNPDTFLAAEKLSKVGRALALLLSEDVRLDSSPGIFWTDAPGDKAVLGTYELYKECAEEYLEQAA